MEALVIAKRILRAEARDVSLLNPKFEAEYG